MTQSILISIGVSMLLAGAVGCASETPDEPVDLNETATQGVEADSSAAVEAAASTFVENDCGSCKIPTMPPYKSLANNAKLPDPFKSMSGTRIKTKAAWRCRHCETRAQLLNYELGPKPGKPPVVTGTVTDTKITVNAGNGTKTVSFTATISVPASAVAPYPAMIAVGGMSLPSSTFSSKGIAVITFNPTEIGSENPRGTGKFYDLYGSNHKAGAMTAWAWGVSRIIDVLEQNAATSKINVKRLGVSGCSRYGKGALVVGALDDRIALTIPQEGGVGGVGAWRIAQWQSNNGENVQTISSAVAEAAWYTDSFQQFSSSVTKLPVDQHELMGLIAPRGLLVIENIIDWLGDKACWGSSLAGQMIYQGLGVADHMGVSQAAPHNHCSFPASQQPELDAYVKKFLLGDETVDTNVSKTGGTFTFNKAQWIDWTVPTLP
jgi:hypothetical protein